MLTYIFRLICRRKVRKSERRERKEKRSVGWEGNLAKLVGNFIMVYSDLLQLLPTPSPVPHLITHRRRDGERE